MLLRTLYCDQGNLVEDYDRPLPNVSVKFQSGEKSFETRTDQQGVYTFDRIPAGTYQVLADLPSNLAIESAEGKNPELTFEMSAGTCHVYSIYSLPTGRISGNVVGSDGKPLRSTSVDLYRLDRYMDGVPGLYAYQGDGKPFNYKNLPGGDYILLFNHDNRLSPDAPFPRTFYPNAADLQHSTPIHLAEGQQILNADIHVSEKIPTREIKVQLDRGFRKQSDYTPPHFLIKASEGWDPYPFEATQNSYTLNLFLSAQYQIRAEALCRGKAKGRVETGVITVDGKDLSVSEVKLTFDKGDCAGK